MLLIGSRALKIHYPDARDPKDWDLIATSEEIEKFLRHNLNHRELKARPGKRRFIVGKNGIEGCFEFEIAEERSVNSASQLWQGGRAKFNAQMTKEFGVIVHAASLETLFLLKTSHITFPIHFWKNIADFYFLKSKLPHDFQFDRFEKAILETRRREIKNRIQKKEIQFNQTNEEFFKRSEKQVKRIVDHDSLHLAISDDPMPLFIQAKSNPSMSEMSEHLVNQMSDEKKIRLIQEEIMVLSIERDLIPVALRKEKIDQKMIENSFNRFAGKMCVHYLPEWLRMFAVEHFLEVLEFGGNYWEKCLKKHPTLRKKIG